MLYPGFRGLPLVEGVFFGIKAAVLAIVISAVIRIGKRALKTSPMYVIAATARGHLLLRGAVSSDHRGCGPGGLVGGRLDPGRFATAQFHQARDTGAAADAMLEAERPAHVRPSLGRAVRVTGIGLFLWLTPLFALLALLGPGDVFTQIGVSFSKLALVTFGGVYAVLAYMAQEAVQGVQGYGWLQPGEMLDGLGMAETTPGPLIQVVQFVGFMAAFRHPGALDPYTAGVLASVLATWVTFVPCFIWIFLGAPYVKAMRNSVALSATLGAITAAVVGVVLNLSVWFGVHVVFSRVGEMQVGPLRLWVPDPATLEPMSLAPAVGALVAMLRLGIGMLPVLTASAAIGAGCVLLFG